MQLAHRYQHGPCSPLQESLERPQFSGHLLNVLPKLRVGASPGEALTPPSP